MLNYADRMSGSALAKMVRPQMGWKTCDDARSLAAPCFIPVMPLVLKSSSTKWLPTKEFVSAHVPTENRGALLERTNLFPSGSEGIAPGPNDKVTVVGAGVTL
jgi:hypothetical protein